MVFIAGGRPEAPEDCAPHGLEARTRDRVSRAISEHGPVTAAALGRLLGLTPAAVRRHLDALVDQHAIQEREPASSERRRGRPARAYVLSEAGHQALNSDYDDVATSALRFLADRAGDDAVAAFARERVARLEERYADALAAAGDDPAARADALALALSRRRFRRAPPGRSAREHRWPACSCARGTAPFSTSRPSSRSSATPRRTRSPACSGYTYSAWPRWPTASTCAPRSSRPLPSRHGP